MEERRNASAQVRVHVQQHSITPASLAGLVNTSQLENHGQASTVPSSWLRCSRTHGTHPYGELQCDHCCITAVVRLISVSLWGCSSVS